MKRTSLVTALCAMGAVAGLQAQVIGDFEGSLEPGWVVTASGGGAPSTAWASTGLYSLAITPTGNGFVWAIQFNDIPTAEKLATTHLLQVDVHWTASEWFDPDANGWVRWDQSALNGDGFVGWTQTTDANITDPQNPSYPGSWDPTNWGDNTRTLTYDFTGLGFTTAGATWAQFNVSFNMGNIDGVGNMYIDNVRLTPVPEPTTLALLGLGGALLVLRRRS